MIHLAKKLILVAMVGMGISSAAIAEKISFQDGGLRGTFMGKDGAVQVRVISFSGKLGLWIGDKFTRFENPTVIQPAKGEVEKPTRILLGAYELIIELDAEHASEGQFFTLKMDDKSIRLQPSAFLSLAN